MRLCGLAALAGRLALGEITPLVVEKDFGEWQRHGAAHLFEAQPGSVQVTWDSSQVNSYLFLPLNFSLSAADRFEISFTFRLFEVAIGTTAGKPYTFELALGLIDTGSAFRPELYRGSGIDPVHGVRNVVEFDYFPDSGFGATVASTVASAGNQIAFAHNFPLELSPGETYRVEMAFDGADRTLRTRMWKGGAPLTVVQEAGFKEVRLGENFSGFSVNALAIASYSDEGQVPPFAGSILARGEVTGARVTVYDRPRLHVRRDQPGVVLEFETATGWKYVIERSDDARVWKPALEVPGTGARRVERVSEVAAPVGLFRVTGFRP